MQSVAAGNPLSRILPAGEAGAIGGSIDAILLSVRTHLGMDVAFVAEFRERDRVFRHVDASGSSPVAVGDSVPLEVGYCRQVVDGRLPELIVDAQAMPETARIPETHTIPIGSHLSVPIRLSDSSLYGTFCCFSFRPDHSLTRRDLQMMRAFADIIADQLERDRRGASALHEGRQRVQQALDSGQPAILYQPIFDLRTGQLYAVESLSRFELAPRRGPDQWFAEAIMVGRGPALEAAAASAAFKGLHGLQAGALLAFNASPDFILSSRLPAVLQGFDLQRLIIEVTEHAEISEYGRLSAVLAPFRAAGLRLAIDDTGAGYSSLRHVLQLEPDIVKLDISLTRSIHEDKKRQALAASLIAFAHETQMVIVAEGVETQAELETLLSLGVTHAQGYYLGRPMALAQVRSQLAADGIAGGGSEARPARPVRC